MTVQLSSEADILLSKCALLRWFDYEIVTALAACPAELCTGLLNGDLVEPVPDLPGTHRLRAEVRTQALARLRAHDPGVEITFHQRALRYMARHAGSTRGVRRTAYADACLHHLGELFFLLLARKEWWNIAANLALVRRVAPWSPRGLRRLRLYNGYLKVRTQRYGRGKRILHKLLDRSDLEPYVRVHALNALAQAYWYEAHYDRALVLYRQLHDVASEMENLTYRGVALLNMSAVYFYLDDYERTVELSQQSLDIFRALGDLTREADALSLLGDAAIWTGQWQTAREHLEMAIALYRRLDIQARLANLHWCQGLLYQLLGDEPASEAAYRQALVLAEAPASADTSVCMDSHAQLGLLYQLQSRYTEAHAALMAAAECARDVRNTHRLAQILYQHGNLHQAEGRTTDALYTYRQAITTIETLRGETDDEALKIGLLGTTQQLYEAMVLLCLECERPRDAFDYVERARSRALLDLLASRAPELHATAEQPVATLAEVQARLPAGAVLVEYFTTGVVPRGENLLHRLRFDNPRLSKQLALPERVLIFAVTRDTFDVQTAALNPNVLQPAPFDPGPSRRLLAPRLRTSLYTRLIAPIQHLLRHANLLFVIPHGPLHYVPFAALCSEAASDLLASDGPTLAFAPSATILLRNCLGRPAPESAGFLAIGYNDENATNLSYAEAEARAAAHLMQGEAWIGTEPKRDRLRIAGRYKRWIHFAGHAIFRPDDPLGSALRLGSDDTLTAREIMGDFELNAELVTLSACTTGLSHVIPGDELLGLPRALLYAGVPAVVCTLWESTDLVSLLVMERFYTDIRAGKSAARALCDAQIAVREMTGRDLLATLARWQREYPEETEPLSGTALALNGREADHVFADPYFWAPFILIGRPM